MIDALIPVRGLAEAVGRPHERQARLLGRFHVALRVADVDRVADIAALTQQAQRLPLRQARVPEAVEVADQAAETALLDVYKRQRYSSVSMRRTISISNVLWWV